MHTLVYVQKNYFKLFQLFHRSPLSFAVVLNRLLFHVQVQIAYFSLLQMCKMPLIFVSVTQLFVKTLLGI